MRQFLVSKFACSECGTLLSIESGKSSNYAEGQPTGSEMVESVVLVEPCSTCLRPMREMKEAVKTLIGVLK